MEEYQGLLLHRSRKRCSCCGGHNKQHGNSSHTFHSIGTHCWHNPTPAPSPFPPLHQHWSIHTMKTMRDSLGQQSPPPSHGAQLSHSWGKKTRLKGEVKLSSSYLPILAMGRESTWMLCLQLPCASPNSLLQIQGKTLGGHKTCSVNMLSHIWGKFPWKQTKRRLY